MTLKEYNKVFCETVKQLAGKSSMRCTDFHYVLDGRGGFSSAEFFSASKEEDIRFVLFPSGCVVGDADELSPEMMADIADASKTIKRAWQKFLDEQPENVQKD